MKKAFYIYKVVNLINGLPYIGRSANPKKRLKDHFWRALKNDPRYYDCVKFYNSINAHGVENFSSPEILAIAYSHEEICILESFYARAFDSVENGLNCNYGGEGGMPGYKFSEQSKQKMSQKAKNQGRSKGSKNPKASMNEAQVISIKKMLKSDMSPEIISNILNISLRKIRRIKYGETWAHIQV